MYLSLQTSLRIQRNVEKTCTFSSLVSHYGDLYVTNDTSKTHLCVEQLILSDGDLYHTRAVFDMRLHQQTLCDTISCSAHSCSFPIMSIIKTTCNISNIHTTPRRSVWQIVYYSQ